MINVEQKCEIIKSLAMGISPHDVAYHEHVLITEVVGIYNSCGHEIELEKAFLKSKEVHNENN